MLSLRVPFRPPCTLSSVGMFRDPVITSPHASLVLVLATCVVTAAARAARTIGQADLNSVWPVAIAAMVVGSVLFGFSVLDERHRPQSVSGWLVAGSAAAGNSLVLFSAALGIDKF